MKFKKDAEGKLVLDESGDPIAISDKGESIDLSKVVALGKHERIASERDEYKGEAEKLRKQIDELSAKSGSVEELQKQITDLQEKATQDSEEFDKKLADKDAEFAANTKDHAIDVALLGVGVDKGMLRAAKALIDSEKMTLADDGTLIGFDGEKFKTDYPSLIDSSAPVDMGAPPSGSASGADLEEMDMDAYAKARMPKAD
jgi:hypothetical protein